MKLKLIIFILLEKDTETTEVILDDRTLTRRKLQLYVPSFCLMPLFAKLKESHETK